MAYYIPLKPFMAMTQLVSTELTRYYLTGVAINSAHLAATDGTALLRYELDNIDKGHEDVIIKVDVGEKALKVKCPSNQTLDGYKPYMVIDLDKLIIETYPSREDAFDRNNRMGVCGFELIDGTFPEYERIIPKVENMKPDGTFRFDPVYVSKFAKAQSIIYGRHQSRLEFVMDSGMAPALVNFPKVPRLLGILMGTRN